MTRLNTGGRIDRDTELRFTFDGQNYVGFAGDTLASALLANGVHRVATSMIHGRPRGIMTAGADEPSALVRLDSPAYEPMVSATTVELVDGLVAHGLAGRGTLSPEPDPGRYDAVHVHCEVLVVGGGPAGLTAAMSATLSGARVVVVDDQPEAGGQLLGTCELIDGAPAQRWIDATVADLAARPDVTVLARTTAFGYYDDGLVLAVQNRTDHPGAPTPERVARQRIWRIRAAHVVVATGAHERPVVFADDDRPGIMLAGSARTYLHRYAVRPGNQVVVFTTTDSAYAAAFDFADAGATVAAVVDARPSVAPWLVSGCARRGIALRPGHVVSGTSGDGRVSAARVADFTAGQVGVGTEIPCDLLLVSGGWNPAVHLYSHAGGRLAYDDRLGAFLPGQELPGIQVVGSAAGQFTLSSCLHDGAAGAARALAALGGPARAAALPTTGPAPEPEPGLVLWAVPEPGNAEGRPRYVDLQRDAMVSDVRRAVGAGLLSVELVKRYTTIGTAHDQGKTSGVIASGIAAEAMGVDVGSLGTTTFRPPYLPVSFAALAGRDCGPLHDPVRTTALHSWHAERGAVFENVGQWKRPRYYPQPGEDLEAAVKRECRAAREGVALMDASTLGKVVAQGPDAGEFLDRMYTNLISTLRVGSVRYGVMCGLDGMVLDDGTVTRVSDSEFLLSTTTGNAAQVLDWMEEWLQTEWPHLRVYLTSVTEHWVTIPLVGPASRAVLAALAPDLDVSREGFPFMTWRDTHLAGVPARVCRISFSGELAYEINVNAWYGLGVWEHIMSVGAAAGITPYGTEAMHVLRAEKGYPIVGQDTDGTVTPQDLGLSWVVSKKKPDFLGKRSFTRAENLRADRKHLVGLVPLDPRQRLDEGAQVLTGPPAGPPPVPMLGHVTSSYRSAALNRTFGLALIRGGRDRVGDAIYAWQHGELVPATVTHPVLYDKDGLRRDG